MLPTKLILIDGLPGSGKSTTGQKLYRVLHNRGIAADFYHEFYQPHPIFGTKADSATDGVESTLSKWEAFVRLLSNADHIAILDAAAFQCTIGDLLEMDADRDTMRHFASTVLNMIRPLQPRLIYIYQQDTEAAMKRVCEQRPSRWKKRVETLLNDTAYGRNRQLDGLELYFDYNRTMRALADELFQSYDIPKLSVENSDRRWDIHFDKICQFLEVERLTDRFEPGAYCGKYSNSEGNLPCTISVVDGSLQVAGLFKIVKGLLPKHDDVLFVQTWPDELIFSRDETGRVISFRSTGTWNRLGDRVWIRAEAG